MIGDILAKLGRRETLTTAEQQEIRLWGNNIEFNNSVTNGMQNGISSISVNRIQATGGDFRVPPNNASVYTSTFGTYVQSIVKDVNTVLDDVWQYAYENPDSVVKAYDLATGKFYINPSYIINSKANFVLMGSFELNLALSAGADIETNIYIDFKRKSNGSSIANRFLFAGRATNATFGGNISVSFDTSGVKLEDTYFEIVMRQENNFDLSLNADVCFFRVFS